MSRTIGGREPIGAQIASREPFCPTRASSLHEGLAVNGDFYRWHSINSVLNINVVLRSRVIF
ncbi:hypothetical protein, partial [Acidiphilium sp. 37-64-53]|uniref:hypothetical protein n=1 Tax=Acidiphilium sp. 37-64-53 TaxID=1970299 RepID=UPI00257FBFDC